ncbi:MAG: carboxymuconolactone decarboxylase family protein [Pseudanabaenaceae cyanobacterium bins.68]|nr:carboxymuconolactone decarboxylase family protein [Pseudanabaenaceae cyanobacterium bins.68]
MAYTNAVLEDLALQAGLRQINPKFGDFCIRAAGEVWGMPLISQQLKALITIAIDVVNQDHVGAGNPFGAHVHMAMQQGASRDQIEEVLLFTCVYTGFNKAAGAFGTLNEILGSSPYPLDHRLEFDPEMLERSQLKKYIDDVEDAEFSDLFFRVSSEAWGLPLLSIKEKALLAMAIDIAHQIKSVGKINPFIVHVKIAIAQGATRDELEELIKFCCVYAGFSKGAGYFEELKQTPGLF